MRAIDDAKQGRILVGQLEGLMDQDAELGTEAGPAYMRQRSALELYQMARYVKIRMDTDSGLLGAIAEVALEKRRERNAA